MLPLGTVTKSKNIGRIMMPEWLGLDDNVIQPMDYQAQIEAYQSWIYVCVTINSVSVAQQKLKLYVAKNNSTKIINSITTKKVDKKTKDFLFKSPTVGQLEIVKKAIDIEEVIEHPFLKLMKNVNPFMNGFDLSETTQMYLELTGNAYWYIYKNNLGIPSEIWYLHPQNMVIVPDSKKFIKGYVYKKRLDKIPFDENEIIHFKFPNPYSYYYGMSPLAAQARAYNLNKKMDEYELATFKNMGAPFGAFETEESLEERDFDRLKTELQQVYGGMHNVNKASLLDKGVTFKNYGIPPKDMSYAIGRNLTQEQIFAAYRVPISKAKPSAKYSNMEIMEEQYMKDGVSPRLLRREEKYNEKMLPLYDDNIFVAYDDPVPENKEFKLKENTEYVKSNIRLINEVRGELGYDDINGGDTGYMPFNLVPMGSSYQQQQVPQGNQDQDQTEEAKFNDKLIEHITTKILRLIK